MTTNKSRRQSFALALVLAAATLACGARDEKKATPVDAEDVAKDKQVLEQLRSAGSDLSKPHHIDFYLYLPSQTDAEAAAAALRPLGYSVTVQEGVNGINWLCLAARTMLPTTQELSDARVVFKRLALRYGGVYDGWDAAIQR
jgi:regulator of RNase E activity RraB